MKTVELEMRLPYREKGAVLAKILRGISGRVKSVHVLPPDHRGVSEVRLELSESDPESLRERLKKMIKNGGFSLRIIAGT